MYQFFTSHPILITLVAFLVGLALMPFVIKIARKKQFVVHPTKRMSHTGDIPNVGGLDICFSFLICYVLFTYDGFEESRFLIIGLLLIVMVGFADDILDLSPLGKLVGEMAAGIALICFADIRITHLHGFLGIYEIGLITSYLLSLFVLVVIDNALNLIDGVDGLASGLGIIYCIFFALFFQLCGEMGWAALGYSMIGALLVFFIYNVFGRSRRKIFMGDSGSLLLGYLITAFVFKFCEINAYRELSDMIQNSAAPAVAICVLSIPLFDTIRVMVTRLKHHQSPFKPDKNHIHHLLLQAGCTHLQTTGVIVGISILFLGLAYLGRNWNMWLLVGVDLSLCSLFTWTVWHFSQKNKKEEEA